MDEKNPCGMLVHQLHVSLERLSNNVLQSHNMTMTQLEMLTALVGAESNELTLKELEKIMHTSQPAVAGVAVRLEKKKYVDGITDSTDRRIKKIRLTELGRKYFSLAKINIKKTEEQMLAGFSREEREIFLHLLNTAIKNLS